MTPSAYPYVMFVLIILSTFGYVSFCRLEWRFSFTASIPFVLSCQTLLMMASGFCHCMKQFSWVMFAGGLLTGIWLIFRSIKCYPVRKHQDLLRYFGSEYLFVFLLFYSAFLYFYPGNIEYWGRDYPVCWYNHFLYLVFHNHWPQADYHNYARAYCMIGNAYSCYLANILHDTGTHIYSFGTILLTISGMIPLYGAIQWKKINLADGIIGILVICIISGLTCDYVLLCGAGVMLIIHYFLRHHDFTSTLADNIQLIFVTLWLFGLLTAPGRGDIANYPFDSVLGGYSIAILSIFMLDFGFGKRKLSQIWLFIPILAVLSHLKPTGIIPAIYLALFISVYLFIKWFKYHFQTTKSKYIVMALIIGTMLIPLISYFSWQAYMRSMNWHYHEKTNFKEKIIKHLKNGADAAEIQQWKNKIRCDIGLLGYDDSQIFEKNEVIKFVEKKVGNFLIKNAWNFDKCHVKNKGIQPKYTHHLDCVIILLFLSLFCLFCIKKHRFTLVYCILGCTLFYALVCFNQYYLTVMYSNVPALFRYLWYGIAIMFTLGITSILILFKQRKLVTFIFLLTSCCYVFNFMLFNNKFMLCNKNNMNNEHNLYAGINAGFMVNSAKVNDYFITVSKPVGWEYEYENWVRQFHKNMHTRLGSMDDNMITFFRGGKTIFSNFRYLDGNLEKVGFYYNYKTKPDTLHCDLLYHNQEAFDLVSKAYSDRKLENFKNVKPLDFKIDNNFSEKNKWITNNSSMIESLIKRGHNQIQFDLKKCNLEIRYDKSFFFFDEDTIIVKGIFEGKIANKHNFSLGVHLYDPRWRAYYTVPFTIHKISEDKYAFTGKWEAKYINKPTDWDHYRFQINIPQGSKGKIYAISLSQQISGCLDLEKIIDQYRTKKHLPARILFTDNLQKGTVKPCDAKTLSVLAKCSIDAKTFASLVIPDGWCVSLGCYPNGATSQKVEGGFYFNSNGGQWTLYRNYIKNTAKNYTIKYALSNPSGKTSKVKLGILKDDLNINVFEFYDTIELAPKSEKICSINVTPFNSGRRFAPAFRVEGEIVLKQLIVSTNMESVVSQITGKITEVTRLPIGIQNSLNDCNYTVSFEVANTVCGNRCPKNITLILPATRKGKIVQTGKLSVGDKITGNIVAKSKISNELTKVPVIDNIKNNKSQYYLLSCTFHDF